MLPFVLPEGYSGSEKCSACAQCAMEAAGGARRSHGAGMAKKSDGTHVVLIMEKCACVAHCVVHANCGEQFARSMSNVDAGRAVRSRSRVVPRMCQSRRCALPRRGRRWRACDFVGNRFMERKYRSTPTRTSPTISLGNNQSYGILVIDSFCALRLEFSIVRHPNGKWPGRMHREASVMASAMASYELRPDSDHDSDEVDITGNS